eukprot:augustus_masked-scaffold_7-processed-gene-8.3-mRNA-1 protein AED:1.00 eAED:1.00 QI:0/0/0/0/1/1/3/0/788
MVDNIPEEYNEIGIGEGNIGGKEGKELLSNTISEKTQESKLSEKGKKELRLLLAEHTGSLGLKQSNAQISLMTLIEVTLKPGSRVLRADGYHLKPEQEKFLELKFKALQQAGIVEPAKNLIWGHPVFVVPKKMAKPKGWATMSSQDRERWKADNILNRHRMVSNMVRLNKITMPTSLTLPNLERQLLSVRGSRVNATLDILSGFNFLETEEKSKDIFTLVTRRSAWRLREAPMGWMNTPALFCERVVNEVVDGIEVLFGRETNGVICWLDDLLIYAEFENKLLEMLKLLFIRAAEKRVRFNLRKCDFTAPKTIWCRREIKNGFWNFSPSLYEKVLEMEKPLAELRKPFADFANLGGKKLADIERLKQKIVWTEALNEAYELLKETIAQASNRFLTSYDPRSPLLLFTDSSYDVWSMAIFQDDHKNITNDIRTLKPKPMMFLSGSFTPSEQQNEKRIYWDRLYRWAIRLQTVDFTVFHIPSRDNFFSDLLTRWAVEEKSNVARVTAFENLYEYYDQDKGESIPLRSDFGGYDEKPQDTDEIAEVAWLESGARQDLEAVYFEPATEGLEYERELSASFGNVRNTTAASTQATSDGRSKDDNNDDGTLLDPRIMHPTDETIHSAYNSVVEELFQEHISYLSPSYHKKWEVFEEEVLKKRQDKLSQEFKEKCEAKEGLLYKEGKLVIPKSLCSRYIVTNHINKAHPSKTAENKYLKAVHFEGVDRKSLDLLLKSFRRRCLHCQREPFLIRRPYKMTPLARRTREIIHAGYLYINKTGYILAVMDSCSRKVML